MYVGKKTIHGGSLILVRNSIKSKEWKDVVNLLTESSVEFSCLKLEYHIIVNVYRPSQSDHSIFEIVMAQSIW